jgi:MYXO-CTERM domain-containing protein
VTVDPLYATASTTITGTGEFYAWSVAGAGDVNGDGYDDVLVGSSMHNSARGQVLLYLGSASGVSETPSVTLDGDQEGASFGVAVAGAGDVDADGYDDVLLGARGYDMGAGRAYLYRGSATGLSTSPATTLTGSAGQYLGAAVASAGDVNGDGYADVIVGAPTFYGPPGEAFVYLGSASGLAGTAAVRLGGERDDMNLGTSVARAGDVNGDGYDDVIVGATGYVDTGGQAHVYLGSAAGISSTSAADYAGAAGDGFGQVAGAGDVNGDGFDDVLIGAYDAETASLYLGSASGVSDTAAATIAGASNTRLGGALCGLGDLDHDGYDDILVAADGVDVSVGEVYLYKGSASGLAATPESTLRGAAPSNYFGHALGAADVNGDGYPDAIVGAYGAVSNSGQVTIYHGYADLDADGYTNTEDCDDSAADVHPGATDLVGDGIDQDCDGVDACYEDLDGDDYGSGVVTEGSSTDCSTGEGSTVRSDCDDASADTHPGATDIPGDGIDQDCDGVDATATADSGDTGDTEGTDGGSGDGGGKGPGCGCTSGGSVGAWGALGALVLAARRRRTRDPGPTPRG